MPIIFFLVSLFFSNQSAVNHDTKSSNGETKETVKTPVTPNDGREFIIGVEGMP